MTLLSSMASADTEPAPLTQWVPQCVPLLPLLLHGQLIVSSVRTVGKQLPARGKTAAGKTCGGRFHSWFKIGHKRKQLQMRK